MEGVDEVLGIGFGEVFNAEIVDAEDEGGASGFVAPKARSEWHGCVAIGCQLLD